MKKDPTGLLETEQNRLEPGGDSHPAENHCTIDPVKECMFQDGERCSGVAEQVRSLKMTTLPAWKKN